MLTKIPFYRRIIPLIFPLLTLVFTALLLTTNFSIKLKVRAEKIKTNLYEIKVAKTRLLASKVPTLEFGKNNKESCRIQDFDFKTLLSKIECGEGNESSPELDLYLVFNKVELFVILLSGVD